MHTRFVLFALVLIGLGGVPRAAKAAPLVELQDSDVVVFLGGTNLLHLQRAGHLEANLTQAFASSRLRFRDLSWEADTVFRQGTEIERWREDGHGSLDGLGDLLAQIVRVEGTVAVAHFGQLESMAGQQGLDAFEQAYDSLLERLLQRFRTVLLITPSRFEKPSNDRLRDLSQLNADLQAYVEVISKLARKHELPLVDLFHWTTDQQLTQNGMHWTDAAQSEVAAEICRQLQIQTRPPELLRRAVIEKHRLWYDYWRPANWKLLYGDDAFRQFTRGGKDYISFKEEWQKLPPLIEQAENRIWMIAKTGDDPGWKRPQPEKLHGAPDANIEQELAAFSTSDGLQVNLFASEAEGLTSPLAMRWDPAGRMYVAVTTTYPHVFPGDLPNDKILLLEDTDYDGRADRSSVFADGLNIPTGLEVGPHGVYVGQNTQVLYLQDRDGDGTAETRSVLLSGFGNGDSHQTINSFVWSPDGELFFGHGDGCESRVETPWGVSELFNAGYFRLRSDRLELTPFLSSHMGPGNPWGIGFDRWGQPVGIDGAGGVHWLTPGLVPTTHVRRFPRIGEPGGYCGIGYLESRQLPASLQGSFVIGDFKANRIRRFSVRYTEDGCKLDWHQPLLQSKHRNFRPVDVKVGPDGAIYVVDWYNPITCHQDDAYRDPTRDKAHGRIWRISMGNQPEPPPKLHTLRVEQVVAALAAPDSWTRYQAKRELQRRPQKSVVAALGAWIRTLDPKQFEYEHCLYEALAASAVIDHVDRKLLYRLLAAQDPRARAFATRLVGRWSRRLPEPLQLLSDRAQDEVPLVRLEAVLACSEVLSAESMAVAALVLDRPTNQWIEYAFRQAIHRLKPWWSREVERNPQLFSRPNHLTTVLQEAGLSKSLARLKTLVKDGSLSVSDKVPAIATIIVMGGPEDWTEFCLSREPFQRQDEYSPEHHAAALGRLVQVAGDRSDHRPANPASLLKPLLDSSFDSVRAQAITLAGIWQVPELHARISQFAFADKQTLPVREAAFRSLLAFESSNVAKQIARLTLPPNSVDLRAAAIRTLAEADVTTAGRGAAKLLIEPQLEPAITRSVLSAMLNQAGGASSLATELQRRPISEGQSRTLLRTMFSLGRSDPQLFEILSQSLPARDTVPDFSQDYLAQLVHSAAEDGSAARGSEVFRSMGCESCHRIGGRGGTVGPDLSAIGTTLSPHRITEEVLWPNRQVKEGYTLVQVATENGRIYQGYERRSDDDSEYILEELSTRKWVRLPRDSIEEQRTIGTAMPAGLPALLTPAQLSDLIHYLTQLGKLE